MRYIEAILVFSFLAIPLMLFDRHLQFLIVINRHTCKDGVWYKAHNSQFYYKPVLTVASVVSVASAGDASRASYLSHFIREKPIEICIDHALVIAGKKIGRANARYRP